LQYSCNGTFTQFGTQGQCQGVADGYPNAQLDARQSNSNNTLGCREYHAQAARAAPAGHCHHAGPSGAGVCGTYLQAWGSIANAKPCSDPTVNVLIGSVSNTIMDAGIPPGFTSNYNIALDTTMNTQACRIYHLGVAGNASGQTPNHCSHGWVSGDNNCGTVRPNLCKWIGAICGFGANATWQFVDEPSCNTALTPSLMNGNFSGGVGGVTSGNTYECRFYHAGVAASYLAGGSNAAVADAAVQRITHCGHVIASPKAGCNGAAGSGSSAPTAAPAGKPSSAPEVSLLVAFAAVFVSVFSL